MAAVLQEVHRAAAIKELKELQVYEHNGALAITNGQTSNSVRPSVQPWHKHLY